MSGRDHESLDTMAGRAVHTVVGRAKTAQAPTFRDLVRQVRDSLLGATERKEFPFDRLHPPRAPHHHYPLFRIASTFDRDIAVEHPFIPATIRQLRNPLWYYEIDLLLRSARDYLGNGSGLVEPSVSSPGDLRAFGIASFRRFGLPGGIRANCMP